MEKIAYSMTSWPALKAGRKLIHSDAFAAFMRERGYSSWTIKEYRRRVAAVAYRLAEERRGLSYLQRGRVSALLERYLRNGSVDRRMYRSALHCWLKFRGRFAQRAPAYHAWLDEYLDFLSTHRGLVASTRENYGTRVRLYLAWQFGAARPDWSKIQVEDIWRYADHCARAVKPITANGRLGALRQFLGFVHLRRACSPQLACAVPKIANYRMSPARSVLNAAQCRRLLRSFDRRRPAGRRDYALTLLMVDLGLRIGEVVRLRLADVDWQRRLLMVPAVKTGRGRTVPLPKHIASALRHYMRRARPSSEQEQLFLRDRVFVGRPFTVGAARFNLILAYRRCGFPKSWTGTHILRRTFATRLHSKGATMRQIADLLGHQQVTTTGVYTQVAVEAMRSLAQPWPL
jgi:site-specific recombinase XerD